MATHSSILAWRIPGTEEPDKLQSQGHKEPDTTEATQRIDTEHFGGTGEATWRVEEENRVS